MNDSSDAKKQPREQPPQRKEEPLLLPRHTPRNETLENAPAPGEESAP